MSKNKLTQETALGGIARQSHYGSNQRLTYVSYGAFLVAKDSRDDASARIPCGHCHRTRKAATACARKMYAALDKDIRAEMAASEV